ncbi:MAG: carboxypeptidase regulatory-like domain-containing protein [Candidatus Hydrogenedentes bacterium]|nr:carboxypeptidase regulatory-like domain-containing protein [Candidatus Hydrogenedentota bacterium]
MQSSGAVRARRAAPPTRRPVVQSATPIPNGSIAGHVFNSDGTPCSDATVEVRADSQDDATNETEEAGHAPTNIYDGRVDEAGRFIVDSVPIGRYGVVARTAAQVGTALADVREVALRASVIVIVGDALSIRGRVIDDDGDAVEGARVLPIRHDGKPLGPELTQMFACEADRDGAFETGPLQQGKYELYTSARGYAPGKSDPVPAGTRDATIVLHAGAPVRGTVIWADTQDPIGGTTVIARAPDLFGGEERAVSGADGNFHFDALAPTHYILDIETADGTVLIDGPVDLDLRGASAADVSLEVVVGGAVRGRVYDAATDTGVPGVRMMAYLRDRSVRRNYSNPTDETGEFELAGLPKGSYSVYPTGSIGKIHGSDGPARYIVIEAGQEIDGVDFPLESSPVVSGTIVDASGAPVAFANVAASTASGEFRIPRWQTNSDDKGAFVLRGFSVGDELLLTAFGSTDVSKWIGPVIVGEIGARDVVITLGSGRSGSIAGKVIDKHGRPVALKVQAYPTNSEYPYIFEAMDTDTNAKGAFVFAGLPPAQYLLQLVAGVGNIQPAQTIQLAEGDHITGLVLTADITESLTIVGYVRDESGRAVANVFLSGMAFFEAGKAYQRAATSEFDGRFELTGLPAGTFVVRATAEGYSPAEVALQAGERNAQVTLSPAPLLEGVVLDADTMEPLERFSIAVVQPRQPTARAEFREFTNHDGRFAIHTEYRKATIHVRAPDHHENSVSAQAGTPITIELLPGSDSIQGTVVDAEGQPVAGAYVYAGASGLYGYEDGVNSSATTSSDGTFELANPPAGMTLISASHPDFGVGVNEVQNEFDSSASTIIRLAQLGSIRGSVRLAGEPVAGATVMVNCDFRHTRIGTTDETGNFVIERIPAGQSTVNVSAPDTYQGGSDALKRDVTIEPSTQVTVDFEL